MIFPTINENDCPEEFFNERVFSVYTCGSGTLTVTATLPDWITFDEANHQFIGAANTYTGATAAEATATAQAALEAFVTENVTSGDIACVNPIPDTFKIKNYTDGIFANADDTGSSDPIWDGTFNFFLSGSFMGSAASNTLKMDGFQICNAYLHYDGEVWRLTLYTPTLAFESTGPATENDPRGIYTNTGEGADDETPATVEIVGNNASVSPGTDTDCFPG
jgi:hypothetical protein